MLHPRIKGRAAIGVFGVAALLLGATIAIAWSHPVKLVDQFEQNCRDHIQISGNPTPAQREAAIQQCAAVTRYLATGQMPPGANIGPNGNMHLPGGIKVQHKLSGTML